MKRDASSGRFPDDAPIDDIVVRVASGEMLFEDLSAWFKANLE